MSATELAAAYRRRELSPVAVVDDLIARIGDREAALHCFVHFDATAAREAARTAESMMARPEALLPLHGIPVALKDNIDVAGVATTCHSAILRDNIAPADAAVVTRLRRAGAIVFGKLALHEFALGGPSFDLPFPPARNPWNPDHHPGGSSTGAGAGLAAGFFPLAIGTDTAGSIRHPAAACGVVGLKPTYDLVSRRGVFPLAWSLDHVGPMARTVADCRLLLAAIAERGDAGPAEGDGIAGLRIGFVRAFHETDMVADPDVGAALEHAADRLASAGARVETVTLPKLQEYSAVNRTILAAEAWAIHSPWLRERPQDYAAKTRRRIMVGAFLTAEDYLAAQRRRGKLVAAIDAAFDGCDVLLTANALDPACRIDDAEALARNYPRQGRTPFNLSGHPAISLPTGLSRSGMPLSAQLVGRRGDEATLLRVAAEFERMVGTFTPSGAN
jgi:aspartyl-tRNA(Asn)/glutamyl-tRNA(Gln) amidotransferase subunit A